MKRILSFLVLPSAISQFERQYLVRINRIALFLFFGHIPVFVGIALLAGTSALQAAVLTALVLIGPALGYTTLRSPRHVSVIFGFTAMCMGGLLVHFGRGAMQIEMHFYFFVLIALLAVFANPIVIVTAAVTVALHHLVLFLLLPRSVFNYDASMWAVVVHAAFVVLESVAACFVARTFFDNVIGLEKIVKRRTDELSDRNADMRLILDNVGQGFISISLDGSVGAERSAIVDRWLGPYVAGVKFWDYFTPTDPGMASWFQLAWEAVVEDVLPLEMSIDQLPKRWTNDERSFAFAYRPVMVGGRLIKILLVMSDVTAQVERERFEAEQRDFLRVLEMVMKDRKGFLAFFAEANDIISMIVGPTIPEADLTRQIHTLKGNCGLFGLTRLAAYCHDLETRMADRGPTLTDEDRQRLEKLWGDFASSLHVLLGLDQADNVEVRHDEYLAVLQAIDDNVARDEITWMMRSWEFEPAEKSLARVSDQARAIAARLGKPAPEIVVEANDLRFLPAGWAEFWSAFVHVVRNALDHGIEPSDERLQMGKPPQGRLRLTAGLVDGELVVEIADDGRGIPFGLLREQAIKAGLPHAAPGDLLAAVFHDGLTTKRDISEFSGRGIGMGAVKAVCARMGGSVQIESEEGRGTLVRFIWSAVDRRISPIILGPEPTSHDGKVRVAGGGYSGAVVVRPIGSGAVLR
jgi:two-component system, chemotaxis family, sensor kinase CheA